MRPAHPHSSSSKRPLLAQALNFRLASPSSDFELSRALLKIT